MTAPKIESVDFFYLAMPEVTTAADGSQDALVVRVRAGGHEGWGECEAAPLPSIAAFVCPMSHGACRPVADAVLGAKVETPDDIRAIAAKVAYDSMDLLQAAHTWSGIEMALWDMLGRARGVPAWQLLGWERAYPKTPYASVLFGTTADETLARARDIRSKGFRAAKFGWAPFGASVEADADQVAAAREGLGPEGILLIDAGQIFGEDVEAAAARLPAMEASDVLLFEEPFHGHAYRAYGDLSKRSSQVRTAGGEAAHNRHMAEHLIDFGGVGFVQIDCGRIGGLGPATDVARYAAERGVTYINHTFTSNLALSASIQPYAGLEDHRICEYPTGLSELAVDLTRTRIAPDAEGLIHIPDGPGLGVDVNPEALETYRVDVEIRVNGDSVFQPPST
ncbi:mandelate racemase/muconate lactonizing enzyme family protein [Alexandriicola marinus]|uniref:mandelate racemase/muconate lactonizing enzyme family protein n=1 Tax=Alexandriicola marinus TaxID=2081710 RepID=UPI001F0BF7A3|nr:mandelate racemase/muconate lactonizing enzyme family protein [Alexandriicola marinus]